MNRIWAQLLCVISSIALTVAPLSAMTPQQRAKLNELSELVREAGKLYTADKMDEAAKLINNIQKELGRVLEDRNPALQRTAQPIYERIARAHALLELEGVELTALPSWDEMTGKGKDGNPGDKPVSFKDEVAPILISACGNCHVTGNRGQFSMSSFEALMKGPTAGKVIFPFAATGSRLIEVIESGDMPRGGGKVSAEQLMALKKWIDQGAKYDSPDPKARLIDIAKSAAIPSPAAPEKARKASGSETVSFAKDIAPILRENCIGCHIGAQQVRGGLRMDNFNQLLRGGDSGAIIEPPKDADSLLVKKLKGQSGDRMPAGGRPPLKDEQIEMIATWIRENATFDGSSPDTNINSVIATAWANAASHADLLKRRSERAMANWKRVLPNEEPSRATSDELYLLGNVPQFRLDEIRDELEKSIALVKKQFSAPSNKPLLRGGLAVYVLKNRYDYSEFGKMTEKRELPRQWLGHWHSDPLDVYCVLVGEKSSDAPLSSVALQTISAAYLASFPEVPAWFAEGVARNLVINNHRKDDQRVKIWQQSMAGAATRVPNAKALLQGELDEEAGGIVGMAITNSMMARNNRARFTKLLEKLKDGGTFTEAMTGTFGKPDDFVKAWVGK
jgi:mono/diheme cytochrome c family protein